MLSGKLIHLIESHGEQIAAALVNAIHRHPDLSHLGRLPDWELRQRGDQILRNLGHWLTHGNDEKLAQEYEIIGRMRFEECVPLHESVRGLCLVKDKMIEFLDDQGLDQDTLAVYAEEQLERRVGQFFDLLLVHLVRGYETAWRRAQMESMSAV